MPMTGPVIEAAGAATSAQVAARSGKEQECREHDHQCMHGVAQNDGESADERDFYEQECEADAEETGEGRPASRAAAFAAQGQQREQDERGASRHRLHERGG